MDTHAEQSAKRRMAMIEHLVHHAEGMCTTGTEFLELTAAAPGFIVLLYTSAWEAIEASESCEALKTATKRSLQYQVHKLLTMVLDVVTSADPRLKLLDQGICISQALSMGESVSDEIH